MTVITSYATGADMVSRYDVRLLGDLVRDDGTREPADSVPVNDNLLAMLSDAYGEIVSVIVVGDRYTLAQIDPANLSPQGIAFLKRLNCDLALVYLKRRRGLVSKTDDALLKSTTDRLKSLQDGASILLGIQDLEAEASKLTMTTMLVNPLPRRNTIRWQTFNYYPERRGCGRRDQTGLGFQ